MKRAKKMKATLAWALLDRRGLFYRSSRSRKSMVNLMAMMSGLGPGIGVWRVTRVRITEVTKP